jgi:hypothetical protein
MAKCVYCAEDTILYINGIPVCLTCAKVIDVGQHLKENGTLRESKPVKRGEKLRVRMRGL